MRNLINFALAVAVIEMFCIKELSGTASINVVIFLTSMSFVFNIIEHKRMKAINMSEFNKEKMRLEECRRDFEAYLEAEQAIENKKK